MPACPPMPDLFLVYNHTTLVFKAPDFTSFHPGRACCSIAPIFW